MSSLKSDICLASAVDDRLEQSEHGIACMGMYGTCRIACSKTGVHIHANSISPPLIIDPSHSTKIQHVIKLSDSSAIILKPKVLFSKTVWSTSMQNCVQVLHVRYMFVSSDSCVMCSPLSILWDHTWRLHKMSLIGH